MAGGEILILDRNMKYYAHSLEGEPPEKWQE